MKNESNRIPALKRHLIPFSKCFLVGMFLLIQLSAFAQEKSITGTVTGADKTPLAGVAVSVKGAAIGTNTDANGKFTLTIPASAQTLVFSFIGMTTQEIPIGTGTVFNVVLSESTVGLNEVVVIGYGTQKKSDLTGSVVRVNLDTKTTLANVSLGSALQGVTAGVNVGGTGTAGSSPDLSIRGQTSLSATDAPLIVLDGIIYNGSISDININDVESIDILKDASSAAVYGSRSANGVMIITTKKGKSEKPLFNINSYYGLQDYTNSPEKVMNADQFAIRLVDFYYQQSLYAWYAKRPTSDSDFGGKPVRGDITDRNYVSTFLRTQEEKDNYLAKKYVDWMKEIQQTAPLQNYDISVSGRTDKSNYYISGSYIDQKGRLLNDKYGRTTIHTTLENKITDWITVGINSSYSIRDNSGVHADVNWAMLASPLVNVKTPLGTYAPDLAMESSSYHHPLQYTVIPNKNISRNLFTLGYIKIAIPKVKGLTYDFNYSNTYITSKAETFYPASTTQGNNSKGYATKSLNESINWILNNIITYNRTFATDHAVNATLLYSREKRNGENNTLNASGFDNEVLGYNSMQLGTIPTVSTGAWEENSLSYMARLNYSFKNRYLLTGTVRRDGFSGFGANRKFATFPSVSLGWVISDEAFLKSQTVINYLKLRLSDGVNGNQGIGRYSSFSKMGTNNPYVFGGSTAVGIYPNSLGNADLEWESTLSYNVGIDFGVLKNRISGSVDVYKAQTSHVLVSRALPGTTGYSSVWTNIGGISNKGIEVTLNTVNIDKQLRWESKFVFSLNRDKISKLYGGANDKDVGNGWFVGQPISAIYDYKATGGVWSEAEFYAGKITIPQTYPGHLKVADLNGDGDLDANNDRSIIGFKTPNYRFSIANDFKYKNFTLSVFINSVMGGNGYYMADNARAVLSCITYAGGDAGIQYVYRNNLVATRQYWTPDNGVTNAPSLYFLPRRVMGIYQDRSFVRLQDVSLSYNIGKDLLNTLGIDALQIYVSGKNLHTWTKWQGWDPEMLVDDYTRMMTSVIGGIKLSF
jgi:TonB-dependent starch-binding outer membrane protein SusC